MTTLRIATRKSPLALWQTEHVAERLRVAHPGLSVELVPGFNSPVSAVVISPPIVAMIEPIHSQLIKGL